MAQFCTPATPYSVTDPKTFTLNYDSTHTLLPQVSASAQLTTTASNNAVADYIVAKHNCLRSSVSPSATDMRKMEWNSESQVLAQSWANNCQYKHNNATQRQTSRRSKMSRNNVLEKTTILFLAISHSLPCILQLQNISAVKTLPRELVVGRCRGTRLSTDGTMRFPSSPILPQTTKSPDITLRYATLYSVLLNIFQKYFVTFFKCKW